MESGVPTTLSAIIEVTRQPRATYNSVSPIYESRNWSGGRGFEAWA